jgi:hypothetical protein
MNTLRNVYQHRNITAQNKNIKRTGRLKEEGELGVGAF